MLYPAQLKLESAVNVNSAKISLALVGSSVSSAVKSAVLLMLALMNPSGSFVSALQVLPFGSFRIYVLISQNDRP
jgi:hypothetical protein